MVDRASLFNGAGLLGWLGSEHIKALQKPHTEHKNMGHLSTTCCCQYWLQKCSPLNKGRKLKEKNKNENKKMEYELLLFDLYDFNGEIVKKLYIYIFYFMVLLVYCFIYLAESAIYLAESQLALGRALCWASVTMALFGSVVHQ